MKRSLVGLLCIAVVVPAFAQTAVLPAPPVDDQLIISLARPTKQLREMLGTVAPRTQTAAIGALSLGIPRYCEELRSGIDAAVRKHDGEWTRNLAAAWRAEVPNQRLWQVRLLAPDQARLLLTPWVSNVGARMQAASGKLFEQATTEVLMGIFEKSGVVELDSATQTSRAAEAKAAMATGELHCGMTDLTRGQTARSTP